MAKDVKTFSEKFGLDKDRKKLANGITFIITAIPKIEKTRKEGEDYEIATIDGVDLIGEPVKYYGTNQAIIDACKTMLTDAKPDGTLTEPIKVTVVERISEKRKKAYLTFE